MKPGQTISLAGYDLRFDGMTTQQGPNYRDLVARFTVRQRRRRRRRHGAVEADLPVALDHPHRSGADGARLQPALSLARRSCAGRHASPCALYHKPLVLLIWLGTIVMVIGGTLSLTDRRLRVGAPKPARGKPAMQPAE